MLSIWLCDFNICLKKKEAFNYFLSYVQENKILLSKMYAVKPRYLRNKKKQIQIAKKRVIKKIQNYRDRYYRRSYYY